ncbi:hypothetical protein BCR44DRAFT_1424314 [Catenaria anguillulae PL171]|uniref:Uncharacterized protein n=1 Tax=Catenaria anguillulae PL171 TaxID=765915 RepID=A0A1Y2I2W3_9FUNG|nr:hypothetical protein BCR44DRAFT_1424314 [Catenaria anguillulae PL171]
MYACVCLNEFRLTFEQPIAVSHSLTFPPTAARHCHRRIVPSKSKSASKTKRTAGQKRNARDHPGGGPSGAQPARRRRGHGRNHDGTTHAAQCLVHPNIRTESTAFYTHLATRCPKTCSCTSISLPRRGTLPRLMPWSLDHAILAMSCTHWPNSSASWHHSSPAVSPSAIVHEHLRRIAVGSTTRLRSTPLLNVKFYICRPPRSRNHWSLHPHLACDLHFDLFGMGKLQCGNGDELPYPLIQGKISSVPPATRRYFSRGLLTPLGPAAHFVEEVNQEPSRTTGRTPASAVAARRS